MSHDDRYPYPRRRLLRRSLQALTRAVFATLTDLRIEGQENIPTAGPMIIIANHFHYADPVALIRVLPWQTEFLAGTNRPTAPNKLVEALPELWGVHKVRRDAVSGNAMRAAISILERGGLLGVFPEGGAWADVLVPARPGTAFIAAKTGAPILPIGLNGMTDIFPALHRRERAKVTIRVGRPFGPFTTTGRGKEKRRELEAIGVEMMHRLAELVPPEHHGVYATDADLRAAAQEVAAYPWGDEVP